MGFGAGGSLVPGGSPYGSTYGVARAIADAIQAAIAGNYVGPVNSQVVIGWPTANQLNQIITQGNGQVSVFPLPGTSRSASRYRPTYDIAIDPKLPVLLEAAISGQSLTFSGTINQGFNVHVFVGFGRSILHDVLVQTTPNDTIATLAQKVVTAVNAAAIPGVSVIASSDNVVELVSGTSLLCNIVGTASLAAEVGRIAQKMRVSIWMPDPYSRGQFEEIITTMVGTEENPFLAIGSSPAAIWIRYVASAWNDLAQSDYGSYESHIDYAVEYPLLRVTPATYIGAIDAALTVPNPNVPNAAVHESVIVAQGPSASGGGTPTPG